MKRQIYLKIRPAGTELFNVERQTGYIMPLHAFIAFPGTALLHRHRVSIKFFPDYKHVSQENYVEYKHIFVEVYKY